MNSFFHYIYAQNLTRLALRHYPKWTAADLAIRGETLIRDARIHRH